MTTFRSAAPDSARTRISESLANRLSMRVMSFAKCISSGGVDGADWLFSGQQALLVVPLVPTAATCSGLRSHTEGGLGVA